MHTMEGRKVRKQKARPCSEEVLGRATNWTGKKVERPAKVSGLSPIRSEELERILRRGVKRPKLRLIPCKPSLDGGIRMPEGR